MWPRSITLLILIPLLQGCAGDQHNSFLKPESSKKRHGTVSEPVPAPRAEIVQPEGQDRPPVSQSSASENNTQQNQTGLLNAAVAKIAENVDASLVKFDTDVHNHLEVSLRNSAELQAKLNADLRAEIRAEVKAELQAQATANAQGIAGLGNEIRSAVQTISSGRDTNNTQLTPEMAEMVIGGQRQAIWLVLGIVVTCCAAICFVLEQSRRRAHARAAERTGTDRTYGT